MDVTGDASPASGRRRPEGLADSEAAARLRADGPNELARRGRRSALRVAADVLREPMLALLLVGGAIYLALGDRMEALVLLLLASLSVTITVVQETRSERALEALRDLASPRALVIRSGRRQRIAGRDVVAGDLLVVGEGDRVPADGWIIEDHGLRADESLLTGESLAVAKTAVSGGLAGALPRAGGDDASCLYAGTLIVGGNALCRVAATGMRTEMGRIGQSLARIDSETPRLQRQTRRLVLGFAAFAFIACLALLLFYGLHEGEWLAGALAGVALGMSLLPEEFPVVLSVFLAMGAMRLSRVRVLARRIAAIETLGSTTVLCTDKTGTLTQNRMQLARLQLPDGRRFDAQSPAQPPGAFRSLAEIGLMASAPEPVDPMEIAFHDFAARVSDPVPIGPGPGWSISRRYPLDAALLAMSHLWDVGGEGGSRLVAAKGAPEAIAELCRLGAADRALIDDGVAAMAADGLRVLGIAEAEWSGAAPPASQREFAFAFRGLAGLHDPLRPSVPGAVRECREAGIRIIMITGDHAATATAIAREAGLGEGGLLTGAMIGAMRDDELAAAARDAAIFARVLPDQKLRIVEALKAAGEIVAMTGDGVNDAPSLKAAHIGVAMGQRGTDVAREAASIVLLDDDFGSIVTAIRVGRRIFDNLRKAMGFIVAVHVPIAGLALAPLLLGFPFLLAPIHIALLEMIIDPVCSLVFEAEREEEDIMRRPPRAPGGTLMPSALLFWSLAQGALLFGAIAALVAWMRSSGATTDMLRTVAIVALVPSLLGLVIVNRSFSSSLVDAIRRPNAALAAVTGAILLAGAAALLAPPVRRLLALEPPGAAAIGIALAAALLVVVLLERLKRRLPAGAWS